MSTTPPPDRQSPGPRAGKLTALDVRARKGGEKIVAVTAYDVTFARLAERAEVDLVLVGDSLGMVVQGHGNTLPVEVDDIIYHTRAVARGLGHAHLTADMPFMSYQVSVEQGLRNAGRLVKEGGAESVKLEGGEEVAELVRRLVQAGIPVMGHVGLTPQSYLQLGGFKVQGRDDEGAERVLRAAQAVADAGVFSLVLEGIPSGLASRITQAVAVPTIGIGAGAGCDGQILVMNDLLGLDPNWSPRFARRYAELGKTAEAALVRYREDVRAGGFPASEESFK